eukprot:5478165-Alexandrium_andersonii.AAC.1
MAALRSETISQVVDRLAIGLGALQEVSDKLPSALVGDISDALTILSADSSDAAANQTEWPHLQVLLDTISMGKYRASLG